MPFVPRNTTLVTVFAGGNDANVIGEAVARGRAAPIRRPTSRRRSPTTDATSARSRQGIRERAPNARIIVLNLPNMAGLPYSASADRRAEAPASIDRRRLFSADQLARPAGRARDRSDVRCPVVSVGRTIPATASIRTTPATPTCTPSIYPVATAGSAPPPSASCSRCAVERRYAYAWLPVAAKIKPLSLGPGRGQGRVELF